MELPTANQDTNAAGRPSMRTVSIAKWPSSASRGSTSRWKRWPPGVPKRGAVGAAFPAQAVKLERRRQVRQHRLAVDRERVVDAPELAQLALATPVGAAAARARVALVGLLPALGHLGDRRLDPLDERHALTRGRGQVAVGRQAEDVERVGPGRGDDAVEQAPARRGALGRAQQDVPERRLVRPHEARDARSPALLHDERRDADERAFALGDRDVRLVLEARLREPRAHPGGEQVRARPRRGRDERVPRARVELRELLAAGDRADGGRGGECGEVRHLLLTLDAGGSLRRPVAARSHMLETPH